MNKQHINTVLINQNRIKQLMRMRKLFTESQLTRQSKLCFIFLPLRRDYSCWLPSRGCVLGSRILRIRSSLAKYFLINARVRREAFWRKPRHTCSEQVCSLSRGAGVDDEDLSVGSEPHFEGEEASRPKISKFNRESCAVCR